MRHKHTFHIEFGFCDADLIETDFGSYFWPESQVGSVVFLPCAFGPFEIGGIAVRLCDQSGEWMGLQLEGCNIAPSKCHHRGIPIYCMHFFKKIAV